MGYGAIACPFSHVRQNLFLLLCGVVIALMHWWEVLIAICAVVGICRFGKKANEKAAADAVAAYKESLAHDDGTAAQESKE
jgi:hypothetical protein